MGYEDGRAGRTGKIGESLAKNFLEDHGFIANRPSGHDHGIDLIVTSNKYPGIHATFQVKGRRQVKTPRWFQVSITPASIKFAWERHEDLDTLWQNKIRMVDFWILVSVPLNEVWVFPSEKVIEIARLNEPKYSTRIDNQYDKPFYNKHGNLAKKQKELNLDVQFDDKPLWKDLLEYRNENESIWNFLKKMPINHNLALQNYH